MGIFWEIKSIKKYPRRGNTQQCRARRVRIHFWFFPLSFGSSFRFRLSRGHVCYGLFMIYTHDFISANGWLDVSFVSGSDSGYCEGHDGIGNYGYTGLRDLLAEPVSV